MGRNETAETGFFPGRIPYAKVGRGTRNIVLLVGGPGNDTPTGFALNLALGGLKALYDEYTFWVTSRKQGQPEGYDFRQMAADTATAIRETFDGKVDAIIGESIGGMVALYLAADHPGVADRYVLVSTGHKYGPGLMEIDRRAVRYSIEGKNGRAMQTVCEYLYPPGLKRSVMKGLLLVLGGLMKEKHHPDFISDTLQEAERGYEYDSMDALGTIREPVLVIGGDADLCYPREIQERTAAAVPGAKLILYPGQGHADFLGDKIFVEDVRAFLSETEPTA